MQVIDFPETSAAHRDLYETCRQLANDLKEARVHLDEQREKLEEEVMKRQIQDVNLDQHKEALSQKVRESYIKDRIIQDQATYIFSLHGQIEEFSALPRNHDDAQWSKKRKLWM
ncbi:hypothetical protein BGZ61DRAFT_485889 [Ilyonectria robusta]|uniref:uncharacterized protein n=1 Tax=Ilyonectria robusta TaxID=1079257 RepID=UPI001E8CD68F|nr:uncharacterized protein BGZ61DRAFT_485889 [Ilyonectria robusta]KAH8659442.1 hypothetical protein BGZ61DRAFT_485889 [Ilyonectria robusta]